VTSRPIAIYYEHPDWFRPLFAELDARRINYVKLDASRHSYDPDAGGVDFSLFFNRMSASAYLRGNGKGIFFTHNYLANLEASRVRVINGSRAFAVETSKALQVQLLKSLGLPFPKTRVVNCTDEILAAALQLGFPLLVKPNIGGRGAGIVRFDSAEELRAAIDETKLELGIDSTALVQEFVPVRGGHITRVETLGGKFLYAIKVYTSGENFNLCPAEICSIEDGVSANTTGLVDAPKAGLKVEAYTPPQEIIDAVEKIVGAAQIEAGSVEYIVDDRDGGIVYYDINALSNFVANAPQIVGFDPHVQLVDYLEKEKEGA
jgi:biotin carboxylase